MTGAVIGGRVRSSQVCAGRQSGRKVCSTLYFHRCSEKATLSAVQNRLIELLPRTARLSLLKICEPIELKLSQVLSEPGAPTRHVYFPTTGFVSLVSLMGGPGVEVGMVGREGMVGAHLDWMKPSRSRMPSFRDRAAPSASGVDHFARSWRATRRCNVH